MRSALFVLASALALGGCHHDERRRAPNKPPASSSSVAATPAPAPTRRHAAPNPPPSSNEKTEPAPSALLPSNAPFVLDEVADVGPAGPASASDAGVLFVEKSDDVALAQLDVRALARRETRSGKTPIEPVTAGAAALNPLARGPAIIGGRAYWVSHGRLVRRAVGGALEVLEHDARDGTRVAAPDGARTSGPATVAYIASDKDGSLKARLWVEGAAARDLTPEAAAASSVALAAQGSSLMALSIEARTGMTPVHAREIAWQGTAPKLSADVVIWVAGPAESITEVAAVGADDGSVSAFIPLARDITRFGLATLDVGATPRMSTPVVWRAYANGLDPAPLAAGVLCGRPTVLYAKPIDPKPFAPQDLELAFVDGGTLGAPVLVASAAQFLNVSLASVGDAALIAYVGDHRTWARTLRCRGRAKRR
jgi:hypothetical protein